jgi:hypothetical protein
MVETGIDIKFKVFAVVFTALLADSAHSAERVTVLNCNLSVTEVVNGRESREVSEARVEIQEGQNRELAISIKSASNTLNNIAAATFMGGFNSSSENKWEITETYEINSEKMRTTILIDRITGKLLINWSMPKNRITASGDCSKADPARKKF